MNLNFELEKRLDFIPVDFDQLLSLDLDNLMLVMAEYEEAIKKTKEAIALYETKGAKSMRRLETWKAYLDLITIEYETLQIL